MLETNYLARKIHIFISRYNIACKNVKARSSPREENKSFRAGGAAQPGSEMGREASWKHPLASQALQVGRAPHRDPLCDCAPAKWGYLL